MHHREPAAIQTQSTACSGRITCPVSAVREDVVCTRPGGGGGGRLYWSQGAKSPPLPSPKGAPATGSCRRYWSEESLGAKGARKKILSMAADRAASSHSERNERQPDPSPRKRRDGLFPDQQICIGPARG